MSNRFEDRFNKLKKVANQDPILLSGLDISILTVVEHRDDRLKLVESLIRKHWEHVHPDKASSAEDRQNREKNRKELEQALTGLEKVDFDTALNTFRSRFTVDKKFFPGLSSDSQEVPDLDNSPEPESDYFDQSSLANMRNTAFSEQFYSYDYFDCIQNDKRNVMLSSLRNLTIEVFDLEKANQIISRERGKLKNLKTALYSDSKKTTQARVSGRFLIMKQDPEIDDLLNAVGLFGENEIIRNKPFLKNMRKSFQEKLLQTAETRENILPWIEEDGGNLGKLFGGPTPQREIVKRSVKIWNQIVKQNADSIRLSAVDIQEGSTLRLNQAMRNAIATCKQELSNLPNKVISLDSNGYIGSGTEKRKLFGIIFDQYDREKNSFKSLLDLLVNDGLESKNGMTLIEPAIYDSSHHIRERGGIHVLGDSPTSLKEMLLRSVSSQLSGEYLKQLEQHSSYEPLFSIKVDNETPLFLHEGYLLSIRPQADQASVK